MQENESEQRIVKWRDPAIQGFVITETRETRGSKGMVIQYKAIENIEMEENMYKCIGIHDENTKF